MWPALGGVAAAQLLSLNLVFFHSKQKPKAGWQWSHIPRVERAEQAAVGSQAWGKQTRGEEADFQGFAVWGLPRESGPVLIFTRCPSNQSSEVREEQGSRSPNVA